MNRTKALLLFLVLLAVSCASTPISLGVQASEPPRYLEAKVAQSDIVTAESFDRVRKPWSTVFQPTRS